MSYYFKINGNDYSMYVNKLKVSKAHTYKEATTAAGNTVVKYINSKRTLDVGIIPLNDTAMAALLADVNEFQVSVSFRDPETKTMVENIPCIIAKNDVEYFTIQDTRVMFKAFTLKIQEL